MRRADQLEEDHHKPEKIQREPGLDLPSGLFGKQERSWLESEILTQVVIGMGRLDIDPDDNDDEDDDDENEAFFTPSVFVELPASPAASEANYNPYFPRLPSSTRLSLSSSDSDQSTPSSTTGTTASESSSDASPGQFESPSKYSRQSSPANDGSSTPESVRETTPHDAFLAQTLLNRASMSLVLPVNMQMAKPSSSSVSTPDESDLPFHTPSEMPQTPPPEFNSTQPDGVMDVDAFHPSGEEDEESEREQAAVGRLSSMSLMAAVVASGCLKDSIKELFVHEVERVAQDPMYWVRREASFALGALAKVVPEELVSASLVPLLQTLLRDVMPEVRSSSLFALPAILSRLPYKRRKRLSLDTILTMSMDDSSEVRQRVLEALGEVLYTFHSEESPRQEDERGPPEELVQMFLGRLTPLHTMFPPSVQRQRDNMELFYTDPSRPLICAFNFPVVTLVLGRSRWNDDLCGPYLSLTASGLASVQRTLAASLGEMARIIGQQNATRDLLPVWLTAIKSSEQEVRLKALECFALFYQLLDDSARLSALAGLLRSCEGSIFKTWRERELVAQSLKGVVELADGSKEILGMVRGLLRCVLWDRVSAVREAGVEALPAVWLASMHHGQLFDGLRTDVAALAKSAAFRPRMTFVACQQKLILPGLDGTSVLQADDAFWTSILPTVNDDILDVRIGVARLVGLAYNLLLADGKPIPPTLLDMCKRLSQDKSQEVRSFAPNLSSGLLDPYSKLDLLRKSVSTFSRPPVHRLAS